MTDHEVLPHLRRYDWMYHATQVLLVLWVSLSASMLYGRLTGLEFALLNYSDEVRLAVMALALAGLLYIWIDTTALPPEYRREVRSRLFLFFRWPRSQVMIEHGIQLHLDCYAVFRHVTRAFLVLAVCYHVGEFAWTSLVGSEAALAGAGGLINSAVAAYGVLLLIHILITSTKLPAEQRRRVRSLRFHFVGPSEWQGGPTPLP